MRRTLSTAATALALLAPTTACADVGDRVDDLRSQASGLQDEARFCLAVVRAVNAIDAGSPETAVEAAEEALAQAPDELRDDARVVADGLAAVRDGDRSVLRDPEVREAADRLQRAARARCDPTS